ncbi:MFS transporter [Dyadobacter crusticola]|uniref:MFS transporter n=1 Tax=Dyadobacter crusticola TaxID=292407 RepID=UPI000558FB9D|nr:MFS transporter [Dyadobacter crusticola]
MSIVTALLIFLGGSMVVTSLFIAVWGFAFGSVQVGWPTCISLAVPDEVESGGSVLVATTQLAITLGAGLGGLVFDPVGIEGTFGLGSLVWLCTEHSHLSCLIFITYRLISIGHCSTDPGNFEISKSKRQCRLNFLDRNLTDDIINELTYWLI